MKKLALFRVAGDDDPVFGRAFERVEPELGLARVFIRAVAVETDVGKDRADLAVKIHRCLGRCRMNGEMGAGKGSNSGGQQGSEDGHGNGVAARCATRMKRRHWAAGLRRFLADAADGDAVGPEAVIFPVSVR